MRWAFLILFLVIASFAESASYMYGEYYFCNETGQQVKNVNAIGWECTSSACSNIVDKTVPMFTGQPLSTGNSNYLRLNFPNPTTTKNYIYYLYNSEYRAGFSKISLPYYPGETPYLWFSENCVNNAILSKKDYCKADFTFSATSCAEAGLPISILTDTYLNAETKSAFNIKQLGIYIPTELDAWTKVKTQMGATVRNSAGTMVSGFPQYSTYDIYADQTHNFQFLWQTTRNTPVGTYTVEMTSSVPDDKCDQTNDIPLTTTQTVYVALSPDTCICRLGRERCRCAGEPSVRRERVAGAGWLSSPCRADHQRDVGLLGRDK
jgi:hypothetical protein